MLLRLPSVRSGVVRSARSRLSFEIPEFSCVAPCLVQVSEDGADRCGIVSRSEIPPVGGVFRNCGEPSSLESVGQNRSHLGHGRHGACLIHTQEKNCSSYDEGRSSQNWKSPNLGPSQSPRERAGPLAPERGEHSRSQKGRVACISHPVASFVRLD